jgi:GT2 family glycosyltransferase
MSKRNRKQNTRVSNAPVDVVVLTGGRFEMLRECLAALDKQTVPHNVYIIDIASSQEDKNAHQDIFTGRNVKHLQENVGFPRGANEGARMGSAPLILFIGDDVTLFEDTIEKMAARMNDSTLGVCGAKLIFPLNSTSPIRPAGKIQHIGLSMNIRGEIIHPLIGWSVDHPKAQEPRDVLAATGACFMIRRNLFSRAAGFDPIYGLGTFEDVDLCLKVRKLGFRVYVDTQAKAYHYTGGTAEKKNVSFPLRNNHMIFTQRWQGTGLLLHDDWTYW